MLPEPVPTDKRKHPRIDVNVPATYRSASLTLDTFAVNLSQTGVYLRARPADPVGTEVQLSLSFGRTTLKLSAVVAWSCPGGMGLRFRELSRDQRLALANFLIARFCRG